MKGNFKIIIGFVFLIVAALIGVLLYRFKKQADDNNEKLSSQSLGLYISAIVLTTITGILFLIPMKYKRKKFKM